MVDKGDGSVVVVGTDKVRSLVRPQLMYGTMPTDESSQCIQEGICFHAIADF